MAATSTSKMPRFIQIILNGLVTVILVSNDMVLKVKEADIEIIRQFV